MYGYRCDECGCYLDPAEGRICDECAAKRSRKSMAKRRLESLVMAGSDGQFEVKTGGIDYYEEYIA